MSVHRFIGKLILLLCLALPLAVVVVAPAKHAKHTKAKNLK